MTHSDKRVASTGEVAIYIGYLVAFMVLLAAAGILFGMNAIYVVFLFLLVGVLASVAVVSRVMG